ncbi:MAG TPA: DUF1800 domain-containing protein, partial [Dehalococcoidia bacterium]|nr:DUF1800 domain-containing protein [Dehalococcoidia bacterium]
NREALQATVRWWLHRMAYGPYPLQEKLTLFWHGHFTTSAKDERSALLMWRQNELLRQNAAGNFRRFVHSVSRDPAMLDYLNNTQNRKAHANENYARELMELFTLGIGNYTETDVKQGARAFTGWSHDGQDYIFNRNQHDTGSKTFLGHTGDFNGDDVIEIILSQPACPRFIASKLWKTTAFEDVDDALGAALASTFVENDFELRPLLRTILTSRGFYSTQSIGAQIKSPVQLIAGTVRMLGIELPPEPRLVGSLVAMGQMPLLPPNVRGWPGGHLWINTSTLFVRYNTGVWLAGGSAAGIGSQGRLKGIGRVGGGGAGGATNFAPKAGSSPEQVVDEWVGRLIQRPIDPAQRQTLIDSLGGRAESESAVRTMVQLIVSMPEYQLC